MKPVPQLSGEFTSKVEHPGWCLGDVCHRSQYEVHHRSAGELFQSSEELAEPESALEVTRWRVDYLDGNGQHIGHESIEITRAWTGELVTVLVDDDAPRLAALLLSRTRTDA